MRKRWEERTSDGEDKGYGIRINLTCGGFYSHFNDNGLWCKHDGILKANLEQKFKKYIYTELGIIKMSLNEA